MTASVHPLTPPWVPVLPDRKLHVIQGEFHVSGDAGLVMTTILGSCVACCLRDPEAGVGGMNHFLLPGEGGDDGLRYGVQSMELLVNALLARGAARDRLEAKLFGGGRMTAGFSDIGASNATFAEDFLAREGIRRVGGSLGGGKARRVEFWPVSGRARQVLLAAQAAPVFERERAKPAPEPAGGELELF